MPRQQDPPLTYEEAVDKYYGGIHGLFAMNMPFRCKCGETTYTEIDEKTGLPVTKGVMSMEGVFKHIRKTHRERIVKKRKEK